MFPGDNPSNEVRAALQAMTTGKETPVPLVGLSEYTQLRASWEEPAVISVRCWCGLPHSHDYGARREGLAFYIDGQLRDEDAWFRWAAEQRWPQVGLFNCETRMKGWDYEVQIPDPASRFRQRIAVYRQLPELDVGPTE